MPQKAYIVGVGMTKFEKPGRREWDYPDMAREAGTLPPGSKLGRARRNLGAQQL